MSKPNVVRSTKATVNLASNKAGTPTKTAAALKSATNPSTYQPNSESNIDQWVSLHEAPSDYSHDEALLLCELQPGEWVSWVPGYGEIVIHLDQFEPATS